MKKDKDVVKYGHTIWSERALFKFSIHNNNGISISAWWSMNDGMFVVDVCKDGLVSEDELEAFCKEFAHMQENREWDSGRLLRSS